MKSKVRALSCSLILTLFPMVSVPAQNNTDNSELLTRLGTLTTGKQTGWKLRKKRVLSDLGQGLYEWKKGKSFVIVQVFVYASPEEATTRYKALPLLYKGNGLDVRGLEMTVLRATVPNLGDENYLWEVAHQEGALGVDFRRGSVVVHIRASSLAVAEQFALQIAEGIPALS